MDRRWILMRRRWWRKCLNIHPIFSHTLPNFIPQPTFNSSQKQAGNLRRCVCAPPQWSGGGDDGSAGADRAAGRRGGRRQLAGLPGGHHPAPLLQPLVQPRCSGCWIRHDRYELPSRTQRGSHTNVHMHSLYRH